MSRSRKAELILLSITLIWGGTFAVVKFALASSSPLTFLAIRFGIASLIFPLIYRKKYFSMDKSTLIDGVSLGVLLMIGFAFQTIGLKYTTSSKVCFHHRPPRCLHANCSSDYRKKTAFKRKLDRGWTRRHRAFPFNFAGRAKLQHRRLAHIFLCDLLRHIYRIFRHFLKEARRFQVDASPAFCHESPVSLSSTIS